MRRAAHILGLGLVLYLGALQLAHTAEAPMWSPRDEIAHYDYIDKLSDATIPRTDELISAYTFDLCTAFEWHDPSFKGGRRKMGLAGRSYEAHQPPLYYALLALPNRWMKDTDTEPRRQIRVLRLVGSLSYCLGALLLIPFFFLLSKQGLARFEWGYVFTAVALGTNASIVSTLGNDSLSLLFGALALLCAAWCVNKPGLLPLFLSILVASSAAWIKLSNIGLVPAVLAFLWATGKLNWCRGTLVAIAIALMPWPALLLFNSSVYGSLMGAESPRPIFATFVEPVASDRFLQILTVDAFNLWHANLGIDWRWGYLVLTVLGVRFVVCAYRGFAKDDRRALVGFAFCTTTLALLATAFLLNQYVAGVHWHGFRHYYAYLPFLYASILGLGWPPRKGPTTGKTPA